MSKRCQAKNPSACSSPRCPEKRGGAVLGTAKRKFDLTKTPNKESSGTTTHPKRRPGPKKPTYQKGANGIVAEYSCALELSKMLDVAGIKTLNSQEELEGKRSSAVERVANDLTEEQVLRANLQGRLLADYIFTQMRTNPGLINIPLRPEEIQDSTVNVIHVGNNTGSGRSTDLIIQITDTSGTIVSSEISLKAYGKSSFSLGSKSGKSSLYRMFCNAEPEKRVSDEEFADRFGSNARRFVEQLRDFNEVQKEFYSSKEGQAFLDEYERRKNTRKVNNPGRRKELGDYFTKKKGFTSESVLAEAYVAVFNEQSSRLEKLPLTHPERENFFKGFRHTLGMENGVTTLTAVLESNSTSGHVINSNDDSAQIKILDSVLNGAKIKLEHTPGTGGAKVLITEGGKSVRGLNLAVWKDGTIQFKLSTKKEG